MASFKKATVVLPEYQFNILASNNLTIYTTSPNNTNDDYPKNETIRFSFTEAPLSTNAIDFYYFTILPHYRFTILPFCRFAVLLDFQIHQIQYQYQDIPV
jgi:hypothetical protein